MSVGGFVAKHIDPLDWKELASLGKKLVRPRPMQKTKQREGAFELEVDEQVKRNRVNTFVKESEEYEKTLTKRAEGTVSFWTWVLDSYEEFAQMEPNVACPK